MVGHIIIFQIHPLHPDLSPKGWFVGTYNMDSFVLWLLVEAGQQRDGGIKDSEVLVVILPAPHLWGPVNGCVSSYQKSLLLKISIF